MRSPRRGRRLLVWRSPPDQPAWARPALLCLAVVAGVAYGWRMGSSVEIFYAAAARSMASSWHDFVFGAFDPAGTISVDKLPGALWLQALSVRLFGAHTWSVDLPQVLEGSLTVLVLYRAVRRLAGPPAGLVAAVVLAVSPAAVTLDRGNISDSLLILLLVLAVDAATGAVVRGNRRGWVVAALWVGLAFQAKMLEAWLVVPALVLTCLVASPGAPGRRLVRSGIVVVVVGVVSLSWMVAVSLVPASQRPYVDGSQHDSVFEQVFDYNGFGRVGRGSPNEQLGRTLDIPALRAPTPGPGWDRLLRGAYGRDVAWSLPAALAVIPLGLLARRRRPRTDPARAAIVLWGSWLVVLTVAFSVGATINSYYLAALAPAVAALLGTGAVLAWDGRHRLAPPLAVLAVVVLTVAYGWWLLPSAGTGLPPWLGPVLVGLGALAAGGLVAVSSPTLASTLSPTLSPTPTSRLAARRRATVTVAAASVGAALLVVPAVASVSVVTNTLGAFDTPFQPAGVTAFNRAFFNAPLSSVSVVPVLEHLRAGAPDLMATQTSVLAAPFIFATGQEVLPIGGYTGSVPEPQVATLRSMIASRRFHLVLTAAGSTDPRALWVRRHCQDLPPAPNPTGGDAIGPLDASFCTARRLALAAPPGGRVAS